MSAPIVIVGGVAAGPKMAAKVRRQDPDVPIILVTDEEVISYAACGTPYYLGEIFTERDKLLVREAGDFGRKNRCEMMCGWRAVKIDPTEQTVTVRRNETGEERVLAYSKLGLATGARPFVPPLEGKDLPGVFTLRSVTDAFAIDDYIRDHGVRHATVVGAGFIGVEMVENFRHRGLEVTLIELLPQVLPPVDEAVAVAALREFEVMGAEVMLSTRLESIEGVHGRVSAVKTSAGPVPTDLVILSIGVRPNSELAKEAGLTVGVTGAIAVNDRMQTSDPNIYAAGDCAEQRHIITGHPCWVPLGSTANKQARVAAVNMAGGHDTFPGIAGTALVRIGTLNIGRTGLQQRDFQRLGIDFASCIVPQGDRPGYMPGAGEVTLLLHAEPRSRKVLGAQAFGPGDVSKRIDILATAITAGMTVDQLANLDLGYAPPYAPALDVVITAANVLRNKLDKLTESVMPCELKRSDRSGMLLVDCREPDEFHGCRIAGAELMPLGQLPERADSVDRGTPVVVYCKGGLRSAEAYRKLKQAGFEQVCYLDGGITAWCGDVEQ